MTKNNKIALGIIGIAGFTCMVIAITLVSAHIVRNYKHNKFNNRTSRTIMTSGDKRGVASTPRFLEEKAGKNIKDRRLPSKKHPIVRREDRKMHRRIDRQMHMQDEKRMPLIEQRRDDNNRYYK